MCTAVVWIPVDIVLCIDPDLILCVWFQTHHYIGCRASCDALLNELLTGSWCLQVADTEPLCLTPIIAWCPCHSQRILSRVSYLDITGCVGSSWRKTKETMQSTNLSKLLSGTPTCTCTYMPRFEWIVFWMHF